MPRYTLAEFFAGGGLARLGFGPNWDVVFANDVCPDKAETYKTNFGSDHLLVRDIARVRATEIPAAGVWWVSFPCKDHSIAGRMAGLDGERSSTVFAVLKRLQAAKQNGRSPAIVILENVVGFLSFGKGADFQLIVEQLGGYGYRIGAVEMDADSWLPAARRRVFVVAIRVDTPLPEGTYKAGPEPQWHSRVLKRAVKRLGSKAQEEWVWWTMPQPPVHSMTIASILEAKVGEDAWFGPEVVQRFLSIVDDTGKARLQTMQAAGRPVAAVMVEKGHRTLKYVRIATVRADTAFTLLASATGSSRQRLLVVDGAQLRIREFTPREVSRLMGAPETYIPPKDLTPAVAVMGDAVAVPVVRYLVQHLVEPLMRAVTGCGELAPAARQQKDGRRPIKDRTVGTTFQLLPTQHALVKAAAAAEGIPMASLHFDAVSAWIVAHGRAPLKAYEPAPRRRRSP